MNRNLYRQGQRTCYSQFRSLLFFLVWNAVPDAVISEDNISHIVSLFN